MEVSSEIRDNIGAEAQYRSSGQVHWIMRHTCLLLSLHVCMTFYSCAVCIGCLGLHDCVISVSV